ncbi:uncharacterized protein BXIN_3071 [Babesia sp. Xinjiang]|uniref:uncharacterized protein n=1 Tax=Babesia sp. Xinjiang TaxID=462227 RepID=UPI000A216EB3|nr:uncharacterized protein BXIN_3071 [Babesia sp. Xinjiang]ORM39335.1 hypothetical protein BXIN_3071 [Babesia sp. Xinjiang]
MMKEGSTTVGTMSTTPSSVSETLQSMEQKCSAFHDALKLCYKESSKIGSGMKSKFNDLMQNVTSFSKTLAKATDAKTLLNFPTKLACCVLLEAITFANNKTKPLVAHNTALQQLFSIIDFLYQRSSMNPDKVESVGIGLDNNELYIYIDMVFKMFETIAKLSKVDESVHLRTVQTLLQSFSPTSPILLYEDILRRSFQFLDVMLKVDSKVIKPIVDGGVRQLMHCILTNPRNSKGSNVKTSGILASGTGANALSPRNIVTRTNSGIPVFQDAPQLLHADLLVDLMSCFCSIIKGDITESMQNLDPSSASAVLLIALEAMPRGSLFEHPKLQALAKGDLYTTMKSVLVGSTLLNDACLILARIMEHGYYYTSYSHSPDRGVVNPYATLYNFVELELIETATPDGLQRKLAWMRGFVTIMQSNEMLNDMSHHKATRILLVEILKFTVKRHKMVNDKSLDHLFEGMYNCGDGHQLISEQIDNIETGWVHRSSCGLKMLPLFAIKLASGSFAMDFCNMTNGVIGKTSRITSNESMDMQQLELVESALAIDAMLTAAHMLYSCVVGLNRHVSGFAPYRIFYPKVAGDDQEILQRDSVESESQDGSDPSSSAESIDVDPWIHLQESTDMLIRQFERMLNVMRSPVMQEALTAVLQALLVVCSIFRWEELYERCVKALVTYIVLVERQFTTDYRKCTVETWSLYLLHIRCLNAMLLNYPNALQHIAWESFVEHLIVFLLISRRLGLAKATHLKTLEPLEVDASMVALEEIHEEWDAALTETIGVFDRLRVHDVEVLEGFLMHFGFHIVIPLLAKSKYAVKLNHYSLTPCGSTFEEKMSLINRTMEAWPDEFVGMIENDREKWPELLGELAQSLGKDSILAGAEPEFLHCLFGIITNFPYARQHNVVMLLTGIMICLVRDRGGIEVMIQAVCRNIVSLCLAGQTSSVRSIDAGVCVLYKTLRDNTALCMNVINGLKIICTTVPQIFAVSSRVMDTLMFATKYVVRSDDTSATIALIDVFAAIVEDSVDYLQDEACLQLVQSIFIMSHSTYSSDNNAAFRVISLVLDFAEKMAARSNYFGASRPPRCKEEEMWTSIFTGLRELGLSEFTEIRQCTIKSLALFIKGRLNRFSIEMWDLCFTKMLMPLAEGLLDSLHHITAHQIIFIVCDELYVAFKDCNPIYRQKCEAIMSQLITGLEKVVDATIGNKLLLPNELNSALSMAISIATNIIIDYCRCDFIWVKCVSIFQTVKDKDIDLLRQTFFKSICNIITSLGEKEEGIEEKLMEIIKMALGDPSPEESDELESFATANSDTDLHRWLVVPPWIFMTSMDSKEFTEAMVEDNLRAGWDGFPTSDDPSRISSKDSSRDQKTPNCDPQTTVETPTGGHVTPLTIYATLKLADDTKIKFTLRDKIQNSIGILQEMQLLQLVTLHYNPQVLVGTEALSKVTPVDIAKALEEVPAQRTGPEPMGNRSILDMVLTNQERSTVIGNIVTHVKEPQLITLVETYSPVSKLFKCLGTIKSPAVYEMLLRALINKYLIGKIAKVDLALQLVDKIVQSVREVLLRFLAECSEVIGIKEKAPNFINSKVYRLMMHTVLPMVPVIFEIAKRILMKHTLQPVAIVLYQACVNMAKYVYLCLYVTIHFLSVVVEHPMVNFWKSLMPTIQFFAALNYTDELESRVRYLRILHAVAIDTCSAIVVNVFSVAPPFIYTGVAKVLDSFADGQSAVLRRIALQRLCDAASIPFIPSIIEKTTNSLHTNVIAIRMRAFLTKRFFFVLSWHVRQFLRSKDCEIEVLAALQLVETNATLPNELLFEPEYIRKHKYLNFVEKRPLVSLTMPYLLDLLESENKRVIRSTRRIISLFLEEMGAQVVPP